MNSSCRPKSFLMIFMLGCGVSKVEKRVIGDCDKYLMSNKQGDEKIQTPTLYNSPYSVFKN